MNEIENIWKQHRAMAIAAIVVIIGIAYVLYKKGTSTIIPSVAPVTTAPTSAVGPGGTFTNIYDTTSIVKTVNNQPSPPVGQRGAVQTIFPAPKGTLQPPYGAGKGDTNWWPMIIAPGATMGSLTRQINWGTNISQLANYRNNAAIFSQMGVNTSDPNAKLVPGWSISV